jgi:hypothetical protein
MRGGGTAARGWLEWATAAALLLAAAAALTIAVRLAAAAGSDEGELLARLHERTDRRVAGEREQLRPILAVGAPGNAARTATAALARFPDNSQLHLVAAAAHRERGDVAAALREYRRAVELVRDYADRRSPHSIGADLAPWLRHVRPELSGPALRDLYYLERALAGGCA